MADEFMKGLGLLVTGGLGWMITAGWYKTPGFEDAQLLGEPPSEPDVYAQLALTVGDALLWLAIIGMLTFWIVIPLFNEFQAYRDERGN